MTVKYPQINALGLSNLGNTGGNTGTKQNASFVFIGSNNITLSQSTGANNINSIYISGGAGAAGNTGYISAGTATASLGTLSFANGSGVSWGINGQTITATVKTDYLTAQTAFVLSNSNGVSFGTNASTVTASVAAQTAFVFSNSNNVTFGTNASTVTASASFPAQTQFVLSNSNGLVWGTNGSTVTGSYTVPSTAGLISAINASAGTTSNNLTAFVMSNSNGLAFGLNGSTITGSYTVPTVTNSSWTVSDAASSATVGRLAFTNLNGITLSLSTGAAGNHTIVGSHNALTSQSNQAFSASGGSSAFQTLVFTNGNGATFTNNAGSVGISYTVPSTAGLLSAVNLSAGTTSSNLSAFVFSNSNNFSFGLNGATVTGSYTVPTQTAQTIGVYGVSNTTGASSSSTVDARSLSFQGAGIASIGLTNGSVVISVPAGGGGGDGVNILAAGTQTANTTGTVLFQNSNSITWGMSNSSVITASFSQSNQGISLYAVSNTTQDTAEPADIRSLSFGAAGPLSVGVSGGSVLFSALPQATLSNWIPRQGSLAIANYGNSLLYMQPCPLPQNCSFDRIIHYVQFSGATNSTGSATLSLLGALYTKSGNSLSRASSGSVTVGVSYSGNASQSLYHSIRMVSQPFSINATPGDYWYAFLSVTSVSSNNGSFSNMLVSQFNTTYAGSFGVNSTGASAGANNFNRALGYGSYSANTSGLPASIAFSELNCAGLWARDPFVVFANGTTT